MSTGTETFDKNGNGGDAEASGMTGSLIIKYLQEKTELRMMMMTMMRMRLSMRVRVRTSMRMVMKMRVRIMLEGRTAKKRSEITSGVMSPTRPGSLHPEQLIYYMKE